LITGVSTGFGRAFAEAALAAGHVVTGTLRKAEQVAAFEALSPSAHAIVLDVTDTAAIRARDFGEVDVLVNNAGYGLEGVFEESTLEELHHQLDVNVIGAVAMTQAVLPGMRARRRGHIINITSMGGYVTFPGVSFYNASKFALEGLSDGLAKEVESLGIHVTALAPGGFRTDWAGRSMIRSPRKISDYDAVFDPIRERRAANSGKQKGDPAKAAKVFVDLIANPAPPRHLLIGSDALDFVRARLKEQLAELDAWETVTRSTDVD
jgi:NAD(P)-dependent dehydrogenase (short-subunit alcohol dehydrogenase family)